MTRTARAPIGCTDHGREEDEGSRRERRSDGHGEEGAKRPRSGDGQRSAKAARRARHPRSAEPAPSRATARPAPAASLVIVESPAKAKTIGKYLGRGYRVKATVGHVRDLPEKKLGIDIEKGFEPEYVHDRREGEDARRAQDAPRRTRARSSSRPTLIARARRSPGTSPSRFGRRGGAPIRRVLFHEITKDAVQRAIENAGAIDEKKVEAQQARRVLDRLVGYKASPVLWKTVKKGLSAGRVQTVALRLLVEREREIRAFKPSSTGRIEALLEKDGQQFTAQAAPVDGKKPEIPNERPRRDVADDRDRATSLRRARAASVIGASRSPTSSAASAGRIPRRRSRRARCSRKRRRSSASAPSARCASRRTSTRASSSATRARSVSSPTCVPTPRASPRARRRRRATTCACSSARSSSPTGRSSTATARRRTRRTRTKRVRPTDPDAPPGAHPQATSTPTSSSSTSSIWQRFMASQMAPAVFDTTTVDFDLTDGHARVPLFRSTGSVIKFQGFLALYREAREEGEAKALEDEQALPVLEKGERVPVREITPSQHFTEPPPRFSEASLVKELERLGIGRPSTYASDHLDARRPALRAARAAPLLPDRARRDGREGDGQAVPRHLQRRLHVGDGGGARQGRGRRRSAGSACSRTSTEPFAIALKTVDLEALIAEAHDLSAISRTSAVRTAAASSCAQRRVLRAVPRLREPPEEVQVHAAAQGREEAGRADERNLPRVRRSRW